MSNRYISFPGGVLGEVVTQGPAGTDPWPVKFLTAQAVTGPLTDLQLRASPVPVSGTLTVTGGLTNTELRASPVPVSGTVAVTGALTDVELRASPVPVSGTVSVSNFPASQAVTGTFFQATQPVSLASLPALAAGSAVIGHVIVDSAPTTAVTGTFFQATQPVSIASMPTTPVTGTFFQATQPVSSTALPASSYATNTLTSGNTLTIDVTDTNSVLLDLNWGAAVGNISLKGSIDGTYFGGITYAISFQSSASTDIQTFSSADVYNSPRGFFRINTTGLKKIQFDGANIISGTVTINTRAVMGNTFIDGILDYVGVRITSDNGLGITATATGDKQALDVNISGPQTRADTFTTTGNGTTVDCTTNVPKYYAVSVKQTGSVTSWDVRLEGSLDGTTFTQIAQHTNVTGTGVTVWQASASPSLYIRSRVAGLVLGAGTNIIATIVGVV